LQAHVTSATQQGVPRRPSGIRLKKQPKGFQFLHIIDCGVKNKLPLSFKIGIKEWWAAIIKISSVKEMQLFVSCKIKFH
jgi:hypothetical protein